MWTCRGKGYWFIRVGSRVINVRFSISCLFPVSVSQSFPSVLFVQSFYLFANHSALFSLCFSYPAIFANFSAHQVTTQASRISNPRRKCWERYSHPCTDGLAYTPWFLHLAINNQPPAPIIRFPPTPTRALRHLRIIPFENIEAAQCLPPTLSVRRRWFLTLFILFRQLGTQPAVASMLRRLTYAE